MSDDNRGQGSSRGQPCRWLATDVRLLRSANGNLPCMMITPRGPLSEAMWSLLHEGRSPESGAVAVDDPLGDDDFHLALYLAYELHYAGIEGIDDRLEWDPALMAFREALEMPFELALRDRFAVAPTCEPIDEQLRAVISDAEGVSISTYMAREATAFHYREFLTHRSAYHLREADPHSFAIPRLRREPKLYLLEIQSDEYGSGNVGWMHSDLFAGAMSALDLDPTEGAYIDQLPGVTLATMNLMSLFALHRRLRGAIIGHLAAFEMTSCIPNRRYGDGLRRLGYDESATRYFDEHVEADAAHGAIAANDLAGSLVQQDWRLEADVLFGAAALLGLDARWADHLVTSWSRGRSSLLRPLAPQRSPDR
jgi:hypothetical protein